MKVLLHLVFVRARIFFHIIHDIGRDRFASLKPSNSNEVSFKPYTLNIHNHCHHIIITANIISATHPYEQHSGYHRVCVAQLPSPDCTGPPADRC